MNLFYASVTPLVDLSEVRADVDVIEADVTGVTPGVSISTGEEKH